MKNLILLSFTIVTLISCKNQNSSSETAMQKPSIIKGMATPVYLEVDTTNILLSDYFLDISKVDSIAGNAEYTLKNTGSVITITSAANMPYISNLRIWTHGAANDIPLFKSDKQKVLISFEDTNKKYKDLKVKGEFNNWQEISMTSKNGTYTFETAVNSGESQYVLVADGKEMPNPEAEKQVSNGMGGTNSLLVVPTNEDKVPNLQTEKVTSNGFTLSTINSVTSLLVYVGDQLLSSEYVTNENGKITVSLPQIESERELVRVYAANGFGRGNDVLIPLEHGRVITDATKLKRTDFQTQIMYFLMVDRFRDGNLKNTKKVANDSILPKANYYGGDLQGVLDKINDGYFSDLGINTIWLSPITQNPEGAYGLWPDPITKFSGYHGYWPVSNTKIDYRFGDEAVFKQLIDAAHAKGMNVLLDYVANHVHKENPIYKEHPDWATELYLPDGTMNTERWDDHRLTTWFDTFMPTLDFSKPEVVDKMTDTAAFWVTNYNLDGFRHDATKHIQQEFWRTLTKKVKQRTDRPIFQIGETYGSPALIRSYISTGMLDAQFDFNLYDASVTAFATDANFDRLAKTLQQGLKYYGFHNTMGNISGNQDRARFISYASGDVKFDEDAKKAGWTREIKMSDTTAYNKLAMLQAFNLTIPGIPCIYYGDEYGSIGGNDPDNRKMMKFNNLDDNEKRLKARVEDLIKTRRNSMALLYGNTEVVRADTEVLILKRSYFGEIVTVIFNKSKNEINFEKTTVPANDFKVLKN